MTREQLVSQILQKQSYLCVGLDSDLDKIPRHLLRADDPQFEFNKRIIDATLMHCVAYKINTAFYESRGPEGWITLKKTLDYIPPTHFKIADAKRGDIGNTSDQYAKAFFEALNCDAVTVAPYMGRDSIQPFLNYPGKWAIVLGITSNEGAQDFELLQAGDFPLYEHVLSCTAGWGTPSSLMFVIGATRPGLLGEIRARYPDHFFLVPGIGAQGGSLAEVSRYGLTADGGLLVNASRSIIFATADTSFDSAAGSIARQYHEEMRLSFESV